GSATEENASGAAGVTIGPWTMMPSARSSPSPTTMATSPAARGSGRASMRAFTARRPLGPVTLLELLARAAPARVVAADLVVLVDRALRRHRAAAGQRGRGDRAAEPL